MYDLYLLMFCKIFRFYDDCFVWFVFFLCEFVLFFEKLFVFELGFLLKFSWLIVVDVYCIIIKFSYIVWNKYSI